MASKVLTPEQMRRGAIECVRRVIESRTQAAPVPDFWEYLAHVKIESDLTGSALIPFQPWPFQCERLTAWHAGNSEVWLKRRQIGASWMAAAWAWYVAAYHVASHVAGFSAGQREANELMRKVRVIADNLPEELARPYVGKETMEISGGSMIVGFPSTEHAGISFTFALILADEAAFHPYGAQNYAAYRPAIDAGGQYICMSTADPKLGPGGFFHDLYQAAVAGENGYQAVFTGRWARPGQGDEWWVDVSRRYAGMPEQRDAYYPESDAEAFVGKSGLVFPMFSEQRHVMQGDPVEWGECIVRVAG